MRVAAAPVQETAPARATLPRIVPKPCKDDLLQKSSTVYAYRAAARSTRRAHDLGRWAHR